MKTNENWISKNNTKQKLVGKITTCYNHVPYVNVFGVIYMRNYVTPDLAVLGSSVAPTAPWTSTSPSDMHKSNSSSGFVESELKHKVPHSGTVKKSLQLAKAKWCSGEPSLGSLSKMDTLVPSRTTYFLSQPWPRFPFLQKQLHNVKTGHQFFH